MLLEKVRSNKNVWLLCVIAIVYYILVRENLFICDDFRYAFIQATNEPVNCLGDAIKSQIHAYMYENGRFLVHTIVQYFAGVLGMEWLRVANVFFFIGVCYFLHKLLSARNNNRGAIMPEILVLLITIPLFGTTYLGNIAMSVNYLWTSALTLAFIYTLEQLESKTNNRRLPILFIFALIVGAWQESFSIGMCVALFVYCIINRKSINKSAMIYVVLYWIGACFVILAPSNFIREAGWNENNISLTSRLLQGIGSVVVYAKTFDAMLLLTIWLLFTGKQKYKALIKKDLIFIVAASVNAIFVACVAFTGPHQLVCIELFSAIVIMHWVYLTLLETEQNKKQLINVISTCLVIILIIPIYIYRVQVNKAYYQMIDEAKATSDGFLIGEEYDRLSYKPRNWFVKNYTTTEKNQNCPLNTLSMWLTNGKNSNLLNTRIPFRKEILASICTDTNKVNNNVFHRDKDWFYIIRTESSIENIQVEYHENFISSLRSKIKGSYAETYRRIENVSELPSFIYNKYMYYILYDEEFYPIECVRIND